MWKNTRAFGLASFCCGGVCCCRSQTLPKSLEPSGVNGRMTGFIESEVPTNTLSPRKNRARNKHTRLLQKPVDLVLVNIIIFRRQKKAKPVNETGSISPRVDEVQCEEVGLAGVCARYSEYIVANTMDVFRSRLHKAVWQPLHKSNLVTPVSRSARVLSVVVPKHRGPWDSARNHRSGKLGKYGCGVPACTLPVQLVTREDYQVGLFLIERTFDKRLGVRVRTPITWGGWVATRPSTDGEMQVGNLHNLESSVAREMQWWSGWRGCRMS
jgi:hypothetical protein